MKKGLFLGLIFVLLSAVVGQAQTRPTSRVIPFSGQIPNAQSGDFVDVRFRLFPMATGGTFVFEETQTVRVVGKAARFSVFIGDGSNQNPPPPPPGGIPPAIFEANQSLWIAYALDLPPYTELAAPRTSITSSGYAHFALTADLLDGLDSTALQRRVTGSCLAGEAIQVVNADGTVTCQTGPIGPAGPVGPPGPQGPNTTTENSLYIGSDQDANEANSILQFGTDAVAKMTLLENGNVGIGTTSPTERLDVAGRVKGTGLCIGSECRTSWPEGDITAVITPGGSGLTGGAESGDVTLFIAPSYRLPQACANGQVPKSDGAGGWVCANDIDTNSGGTITGVTPGTGVAGGGTTGTVSLSIAPPYQLPQTCSNGQVAKWNGSAWICASDNDTTYTAGSGLVLTGNQFSANFAGTGMGNTVARSDHNHDTAYSQLGHTHPGSEITSPVPNAEDANRLGGLKSTDFQQRVTGSCGVGNAIREVKQDGTVICHANGWTDSGTVVHLTDGSNNVGIGTTLPEQKLHVVGNQVVQGYIGIGTTRPEAALNIVGFGYGQTGEIRLDNGPEGDKVQTQLVSDATQRFGQIGTLSNHGLNIMTNSSSKMFITKDGKVGIGTTGPKARLDIAGFGGFWTKRHWNKAVELPNASVLKWEANAAGWRHGVGQTTDGVYFSRAVGDDDSADIWYNMFIRNDGGVGIGTTDPQATLDVNGVIRTSGPHPNFEGATNVNLVARRNNTGEVALWTTTGGQVTPRMTILNNGNVGIGTTRPAQRLSVNGNIEATGGISVGRNVDIGGVVGIEGTLGVRGGVGIGGDIDYSGKLKKLDVDANFVATVRAADFKLGWPGRRGDPGRALVDQKDDALGVNRLVVNFNSDWGEVFVDSALTVNGPVTFKGPFTFTLHSSRELKANVSDLSGQKAIAVLSGLNPVEFNYKVEKERRVHVGFIAEEVPKIVGTPDGKGIDPVGMVAVLTKVVQEQQKAILELEKKTVELEAKSKVIEELSQRIEALERLAKVAQAGSRGPAQ